MWSVFFSHFLGPEHSQACKICPMITFLNKESIVYPFVNFQKEIRNFVMKEKSYIAILFSLTQVNISASELIFWLFSQVFYFQLYCTILLKFQYTEVYFCRISILLNSCSMLDILYFSCKQNTYHNMAADTVQRICN